MVHDDTHFGYGSNEANGQGDADPDAPLGVTLEQYADYAKLPVDYLKSLNLKSTNYDFEPAVRIPYPNDLEKEVYHRMRVSLKREPRFHAPPKYLGLEPVPYGLQTLALAREIGYCWISEGESDTQILWYNDQPSLGIPGVEAWTRFGRVWAPHLHHIPVLLVPVDADAAGEKLYTMLASNDELRDRVFRVKITSPELSDIRDLWCDAVKHEQIDDFRGLLKGQVYLKSRSRSLSRNGIGIKDYPNPVRSIRAVSFTGRKPPGPRQWIVKDAVPKGHASSWYGEGGIAKSFLMLHFAISVASPDITEWAGMPVTTTPAIYGDFELTEDEHLRRAQEISAGLGLEDVPPDFHYLQLGGHPSREALAVSATECDRLKAGLYIADSVGYALAGDSELSRDVLKFFSREIEAIKAAGASVLLVDHQAKVIKGEKYSDKQAFGSVYKTNSVRSAFQLRGEWSDDKSSVEITFSHRKANLGPRLDPFTLKIQFSEENVTVGRKEEPNPNPDTQPTALDLIAEGLKKIGRGTCEEIAATDERLLTKTVRNNIKDVVERGLAADTKEKRGREKIYASVEGGNAENPDPDTTKGSGSGFSTKPADFQGKHDYTFVDTDEALGNLVESLQATSEPVAIDTETSGLRIHDVRVRLIQICIAGGTPHLVDCTKVDPAHLLRELADKEILVHNAPFDLAVLLSAYGYEHRGPVFDTMMASRVYSTGMNADHDLGSAIKRYLEVDIPKGHGEDDWFGELTPEMLDYAAADVVHLGALRDAILEKIASKADHLLPVVDLENRMVKVTAELKATGMPVDSKIWAECVAESSMLADERLDELDALVTEVLPEKFVKANSAKKMTHLEGRRDKVNWASTKQALWAFKEVAGLKGLKATNRDVLGEVDHPMAAALVDYRHVRDVYQRFRATSIIEGRVYGDWDQLKAKTGRMSCSEPPLQGIPDALRRAFVAPRGKRLVISDLSQIEIRVLATICGDGALRADLKAGVDVHRRVAASVFSKDIEEVTPEERRLCKRLVFGTLYGSGLARFTATVNRFTGKTYSAEEVERLFRKPLFDPYPGVRQWMDQILRDYDDRKRDRKTVSYTNLGRRRLQVSTVPQALNTPVQAGALDVMKAIAVGVREGKRPSWKLVGLVHDEVLIEVPHGEAKTAERWLQETMVRVGQETANRGVSEDKKVEVGAETKVCRSWDEKE
jgi:DNA polymerase-1